MTDQVSHVILYIEDNPQNLRLVRKMLSNAQINMLSAMDGLEGLKMAQREKPNLILLDINLPVMDGIEVAGHLKNDESLAHIPVIALTANAMYGDRERYLEAGCDDYLAKPISRRELLNMLAKYLTPLG